MRFWALGYAAVIQGFNWSLEKTIRRRCQDKKQYSRRRAEIVAIRRSSESGQLIVPYHCIDCGFHHIGHPPGSQGLNSKIGTLPRCTNCDKTIPADVWANNAKQTGEGNHFCCKKCRQEHRRKNQA